MSEYTTTTTQSDTGALVYDYIASLVGTKNTVALLRFLTDLDRPLESQKWNAVRLHKTIDSPTGLTYLFNLIRASFGPSTVLEVYINRPLNHERIETVVDKYWTLLNILHTSYDDTMDVMFYPQSSKDLCLADIARLQSGSPVCGGEYKLLDITVDTPVVIDSLKYDFAMQEKLVSDLYAYLEECAKEAALLASGESEE